MPLSEHEQQLLAQLEQQLHEDDPRFVSTMQPGAARGQGSMRNVVLGVVIAVVGLAGLLAGVATKLIFIGVIGFVVMGAGVYVATMRTRGGRGTARDAQSAGKSRKSSNFLQNLEEKWDRRNHGDGS